MSKFTLTNAIVLLGGLELTGLSNEVNLEALRDTSPATTFGSAGWKEYATALAGATADVKGYADVATAGGQDATMFADLGAVSLASFVPQGATDGNTAFSLRGPEVKYAVLGGKVGDTAPFEASLDAKQALIRGQVASAAARTATGTGTALNLGAVVAGQNVYAALHVVNVGDPAASLTVALQSDNAVGFPTPTTVATGVAHSAVGSELLTTAGPLTDTFWRLQWTIAGGAAPSFLLYGIIGIGA